MPDTAARLLSLLSLLQSPRLWPGSELAERLGVTGRTVRRDVGRLRDLGYPVHAERGGHGGYRLTAGSAMPPLLLENDEAVAVALGLRVTTAHGVRSQEEAAQRALGKLLQVLPPRLRRRVDSLAAATVNHPFSPAPLERVDPDLLVVAAAAITNRERLRFTHHGPGGHPSARHVEPQALVSSGRRWQLLAYDLDRLAWRTFRVDRIDGPRPTGARFPPREVPGGDTAAFLARHTQEMAPLHVADVIVHALADHVRTHLGLPADDQSVTALPDGTSRWVSAPDTLDWLTYRLASLEHDFTVSGPPALTKHLQAVAARLTASAPPEPNPPTAATTADR